MGRTVPSGVLFVVALAALFGATATTAHTAGNTPGYTRLVHDCGDDWGWHGSSATEFGPGLVAIDAKEATVDGKPLLIIHVTIETQGNQDPTDPRIRLSFETPRLTGTDAVRTLLAVPKRSDATTGLSYVEGVQPTYLQAGLPTYYENGDPDTRVAFDVGYRYSDLQVQNDEVVKKFTIRGLYNTAGSWQDGDYMPGAKNTSDPCVAGDGFVASGFTIKKSDWKVPTSGGTDPGTDPGQGAGSGDDSNAAPVADFTYTPAQPSTADTIQFTDASVDPDGTITAWSWDFGDGTTSDQAAPTHRYGDNGAYTVSLWVTDDHGVTRSIEKGVLVRNVAPVATFGTPDALTAGAEAVFTDRSRDHDGTITAWRWDFGDGGSSTERSPRHTYATAGTYTVELTVTDDDGATHTATRDITVVAAEESPGPAPIAALILALALGAWVRRKD